MKLILIIGIIMILVISGCTTSPAYYKAKLEICHQNSPEQLNYCQCWASCESRGSAVGKNCHLECDILLE